ncbi:MAG: dihydrofolate reductase [Opitutaceae bacterium]
MPKPVYLIVACSENRVIGRRGGLPWSIPEDSEFFKNQTLGHTVIMGSRSFGEWPSCLQGRDVVVITHEPHKVTGNVPTAATLTEAVAIAQSLRGDIYLCGGQRVYEDGLAIGDRLYLTLVHATIDDGDTFFPDWRGHFTTEVARRESSDANWRYSFLTLER